MLSECYSYLKFYPARIQIHTIQARRKWIVKFVFPVKKNFKITHDKGYSTFSIHHCVKINSKIVPYLNKECKDTYS